MKSHEQDALRRREVAYARSAAKSLDALSRHEREEHDRERTAGFPPPRRTFGGADGVKLMLRAIPGFAGLWKTEVPDAYVDRVRARDGRLCWVIRCMCGDQLGLEDEGLGECPGECGRWFMGTGTCVRVHKAPATAAA